MQREDRFPGLEKYQTLFFAWQSNTYLLKYHSEDYFVCESITRPLWKRDIGGGDCAVVETDRRATYRSGRMMEDVVSDIVDCLASVSTVYHDTCHLLQRRRVSSSQLKNTATWPVWILLGEGTEMKTTRTSPSKFTVFHR